MDKVQAVRRRRWSGSSSRHLDRHHCSYSADNLRKGMMKCLLELLKQNIADLTNVRVRPAHSGFPFSVFSAVHAKR